jgi:hypothetical protein
MVGIGSRRLKLVPATRSKESLSWQAGDYVQTGRLLLLR